MRELSLCVDIFCKRLKELRIKKGLSLTQLAKETGINQKVLLFSENGKPMCKTIALITLAKFYQVSADYLMGLKD